MKSQILPAAHQLPFGQALHLGRLGGELTILRGRVWLTRDHDLGDHVVQAGERVRLAVGDNAVIEPMDAPETISLRWSPRQRGLIGALLAQPLRGLAFLAARAAEAFTALAGHAAAQACRAQGRIAAASLPQQGGCKPLGRVHRFAIADHPAH